jgi:hypothetical protein
MLAIYEQRKSDTPNDPLSTKNNMAWYVSLHAGLLISFFSLWGNPRHQEASAGQYNTYNQQQERQLKNYQRTY